MNVDVYIFLDLSWFFQNFLSFLCSVLRVSPDTDPSHRDRSVSVSAESAAETITLNHCSKPLGDHTYHLSTSKVWTAYSTCELWRLPYKVDSEVVVPRLHIASSAPLNQALNIWLGSVPMVSMVIIVLVCRSPIEGVLIGGASFSKVPPACIKIWYIRALSEVQLQKGNDGDIESASFCFESESVFFYLVVLYLFYSCVLF